VAVIPCALPLSATHPCYSAHNYSQNLFPFPAGVLQSCHVALSVSVSPMFVIPRGARIAPAPIRSLSTFLAAAPLSLRKLSATFLRVEEIVKGRDPMSPAAIGQ
jgi:hypothetical protein